MRAPCLKCKNAGCGSYHDECEIYRAFKEEQEIVKKKRSLCNEVAPPRSYRHHKITPMKCHKKIRREK